MAHEADYEFGKMAVRKGFLSQDELEECLEVLVSLKRVGSTKRLWDVVARKDYMNAEQVAAIRAGQKTGRAANDPRATQPLPLDADDESDLGMDVSIDAEVETVEGPMAMLGIERETVAPEAPRVLKSYEPGQLRLRCVEGPLEGRRFILAAERITIGREETADIILPVALVSRRHASIAFAGGRVTIRDLGSRNGISVSGAKVDEAVLRPGETVRIGKCLLIVEEV